VNREGIAILYHYAKCGHLALNPRFFPPAEDWCLPRLNNVGGRPMAYQAAMARRGGARLPRVRRIRRRTISSTPEEMASTFSRYAYSRAVSVHHLSDAGLVTPPPIGYDVLPCFSAGRAALRWSALAGLVCVLLQSSSERVLSPFDSGGPALGLCHILFFWLRHLLHWRSFRACKAGLP